MAYMPGLRKMAARHVPRQCRDDLVTDTIMYALEKWQNFREDGGMWNWLSWCMRGLVKNAAQKAMTRKKHATFIPIEKWMHPASEPRQEEYAELSAALRKLSSVRHGDVVLRRGMGESLADIGDERGITRERVRQLEVAGRAAFVGVTA